MQTVARKRRVLFVMHMGLAIPSAMVGGLQYRESFANRPDYEVSFRSLTVPPTDGWSYCFPIMRRLHLHRLVDRLESWRLLQHKKRIVDLAAACDVVIEIKIPDLDFHLRLRALQKPRILFWFADGLWLPAFRAWGWEHLERLLESSDGIICESEYVVPFASRFNKRIFRVDDAPQVEDFDLMRNRIARNSGKIIIGWVGSHATACSLFAIFEPLEKLFAKHPLLELRIVGGDPASFPRFEKVRWSSIPSYDQATMIREVLAMDIGLFPLFAVEESHARGTLKAMVYMSGGAVPVCQDLGGNRDLIQDGVNGLLAGSPDQWLEKLEWLIEHPEERKEMSQRAVSTIRARYSRARCFEQLVSAIENV